jgi:uncharacterized protein
VAIQIIRGCFAALAMTVALLFAAPAAAQTFPELTGRVVDQANLLSPEQELDLSSKSEALEASTGRQFVVATVNSLEDRTIEDYGYRLGRHWGIGREGEDDGVILLVAPNEKKVRIETGYGAEGVLPDILAGRIIRNDIIPRFKAGDMAGGIMAGADAILAQLRLPPEQAQARADQIAAEAQREADSPGILPVLFIVVVFFVIIGSLAKRAGGRRYRRRGRDDDDDGISPWIILWGLSEIADASRRGRGGWGGGGGFGGFGGGGGGFGGFSGGGGSFGGGGASGGW